MNIVGRKQKGRLLYLLSMMMDSSMPLSVPEMYCVSLGRPAESSGTPSERMHHRHYFQRSLIYLMDHGLLQKLQASRKKICSDTRRGRREHLYVITELGREAVRRGAL